MSLNMRPRLPSVMSIPDAEIPSFHCECAMCNLREAGLGLREFNPDQPRDRGRWTKGGGSKAGAAVGGKKQGAGPGSVVGISKDQSRVTPRKAGLPANIGRAIFARAGKAAGYKENG